jgi:protein-S-isoprenylcysteine O-methyltransferase Ste14
MNVTFLPGSVKSAIFVLIQFICVGIIAFTGKIIPENPIYLVGIILSALLALRAMIAMKFHFNAAPDILPGATLKTGGPYRVIRHPMYTSLILLNLFWIINDFTIFRLVIFIFLFIDLVVKLYFEEKVLEEKFPDYSEYKKHTKRIIPFIF